MLYGDFQIQGYDSLKNDFEQYIKSKYRGFRKWFKLFRQCSDPSILWKTEDKVGAYIISK
jgi:hypothetical protein